MSRLAVLAAAVLLPGMALADPVPLPTVDYSISYLVQPGGHTMDMAHHDSIMRMDMNEQGQSMTGLMNLKTDKMTMIMTAPMKMAFEMDMNQPMPGGMSGGISPQQVFTEGDVTLTPIGTKTIAGHDCTYYDAVGTLNGDRMESKVCLTGDNVMLFTESVEGGKTYTVTATRVDIGPQDPSRFRVPPGIQVMPMEAMMGGLPGMMGQ